jgi:hypothetical protein
MAGETQPEAEVYANNDDQAVFRVQDDHLPFIFVIRRA